MKLSHPKAFTPFRNDKVHVTVPTRVEGVSVKEEGDVEVSIIDGGRQMVGGASVVERQNGDHYSVFVTQDDWNFSTEPVPGVTMVSIVRGVLTVQGVQKTPTSYILDCVGKTHFKV